MTLPPNFNRLARVYQGLEVVSFGPFLRLCRCAFLPALNSSRRALVLGDGDGRFTARLLRACPNLTIDAVDASSAMLQSLLRRAGPHAPRLRTFLADIRRFQPPNPPYDLFVTHFFLDCLTTAEVQRLAATLRTAAAPHALWLVSEFAVPPGAFGRIVAAPLVRALYWAFARLTGLTVRVLPDHRAALQQSGFTLQEQRSHLAGLLVSQMWQANTPKPSPPSPPSPHCYSRVKIEFL